MRLVNVDDIDYDIYWQKEGYSINDCHRAATIIESLPPVDAKPIMYSKWEVGRMPDSGKLFYKCCHCKRVEYKMSEFCPHCGFTMNCTQTIYDLAAKEQ